MPAFRLAHLSDPHLPPPPLPLAGLRPKQMLSLLAWRRKKRRRHTPEVLAAITADIAAAAPDHIAVTGDLTNFASPAEYAAAAAWLESLGDPAEVTVSPGNHDALTGRSDHARFHPWRRWLGDAEDVLFPALRRRGPLAIFNLCSAVPTALHRAQGRIGADQAARLEAGLREASAAGLFRVVLLHHPVTRGVVSRRVELVDQAALRRTLQQAGAELVLHGHAHAATLAALAGPAGPIPVLGVPSASAEPGHGEAARWHMIEIDPAAALLRVTARGIGPGRSVAEIGRYDLAAPCPGPPQGPRQG
ncbi:MAG: metallophosphoesterase [Alphaproteobacteria bacterium]|nr:metallophosphoesterase [Alphaproteobacteria bacterium]